MYNTCIIIFPPLVSICKQWRDEYLDWTDSYDKQLRFAPNSGMYILHHTSTQVKINNNPIVLKDFMMQRNFVLLHICIVIRFELERKQFFWSDLFNVYNLLIRSLYFKFSRINRVHSGKMMQINFILFSPLHYNRNLDPRSETMELC